MAKPKANPRLKLTHAELHDLHERLNKVREGTKSTPIPVEALAHLLADYRALVALHERRFDPPKEDE